MVRRQSQYKKRKKKKKTNKEGFKENVYVHSLHSLPYSKRMQLKPREQWLSSGYRPSVITSLPSDAMIEMTRHVIRDSTKKSSM
jgi:hypothetical protein